MIVIAGVLAAIGFSQVKKVKKPEKTIESVGELKHLVPGKATNAVEKRNKVFTPKGFLFLSSPPSPIRPLHDFLPRADFCMNHRCRILLPTHSH